MAARQHVDTLTAELDRIQQLNSQNISEVPASTDLSLPEIAVRGGRSTEKRRGKKPSQQEGYEGSHQMATATAAGADRMSQDTARIVILSEVRRLRDSHRAAEEALQLLQEKVHIHYSLCLRHIHTYIHTVAVLSSFHKRVSTHASVGGMGGHKVCAGLLGLVSHAESVARGREKQRCPTRASSTTCWRPRSLESNRSPGEYGSGPCSPVGGRHGLWRFSQRGSQERSRSEWDEWSEIWRQWILLR